MFNDSIIGAATFVDQSNFWMLGHGQVPTFDYLILVPYQIVQVCYQFSPHLHVDSR